MSDKMRILWHINNMVPLGGNKSSIVNEGWISGLAMELVKRDDVELIVCYGQCYSNELQDSLIGKIRAIGYFNDNVEVYHEELSETLAEILDEVKPDVVHIMGSEYPHSLSMYYACEKLGIESKALVSLQGVLYEYAKVYDYAIAPKYIRKKTIRDIQFKRRSIFEEKQDFERRGEYEKELFSKDITFLGRTSWDEACVRNINIEAKYRHSDEILRKSFYENRWSIEKCERKSIFISQATYPIKGFHLFLQAIPELIKRFPDTRIYVAGRNPLVYHTKRINMGAYERYCYSLMLRAKATKNIVFLGPLEENDMVRQYLNSNVFVSPSVIENSCNSVGEAMIMGVPTISSLVGGISTLIEDSVDGYTYALDRGDVLVDRICQIFADDQLAIELSEEATKKAQKLHNRVEIVTNLIEIYKEISSNEK